MLNNLFIGAVFKYKIEDLPNLLSETHSSQVNLRGSGESLHPELGPSRFSSPDLRQPKLSNRSSYPILLLKLTALIGVLFFLAVLGREPIPIFNPQLENKKDVCGPLYNFGFAV